MATNANWRYHPRTGQINYATITDEVHTVAYIDELATYGFYLNESPEIPTSGNVLMVVENITLGSTWDEVTIAPSAGEYWVDRVFETGLVEFASGDNGKSFLVSYRGKGSAASQGSISTIFSDLLDPAIADYLPLNFTSKKVSYSQSPPGGSSISSWASATPGADAVYEAAATYFTLAITPRRADSTILGFCIVKHELIDEVTGTTTSDAESLAAVQYKVASGNYSLASAVSHHKEYWDLGSNTNAKRSGFIYLHNIPFSVAASSTSQMTFAISATRFVTTAITNTISTVQMYLLEV